MKNIITFSGWGQPHDALDNIAKDADHINYFKMDSIDELFKNIEGTSTDIAIGWSLGGQIALRAIENGCLKANKVILLATPFSFLENESFKFGMNISAYENFKNTFTQNPKLGMKKFSGLIARNDEKQKEILKHLKEGSNYCDNWIYWLEELEHFRCSSLAFKNINSLTIIHGRQDTIVDVSQIGLFLPFAPFTKTKIIENCGHAPHLNNPQLIIDTIKELQSL